MTPAATSGPYRVPPEPKRWPAIALAATVHAGLLLFLWMGISWQNTEPVAVEAEVWDMKTQAAAPPPPPPPEAVNEPEPPPPPVTRAEPPPAPAVRPPEPKAPDIALERAKIKAEKLRQEQKLAEEREAREKLKAQELAEQKAAKLAEQKAEKFAEQKAEKLAQKKAADKAEKLAQQKAAELADKKLADKKLAEKAAADKKLADNLAKSKLAAEDNKLKAMRDAEMRRITGAAGNGDAPKSTAPHIDTGYVASITSKVKNNMSYAGSTDLPGNPHAVFKVEQLPTGEIISVRLVKNSGVSGFDDSVEKAIIKSSPLPKKKDGTVARTLEIVFSMRDLN
jgi:colicin import membrane protein